MGTSDIVLVAGATGGVGRRVVDILRKKGIPVRVLVLLLTYLAYKILLQIIVSRLKKKKRIFKSVTYWTQCITNIHLLYQYLSG